MKSINNIQLNNKNKVDVIDTLTSLILLLV